MIKVGDRFETIRGEEYVVVEYKNSREVTVEFCDKYKHRLKTRSSHIENGQIKNPYFPRIFGVGYFGVGEHESKAKTSEKDSVRSPAYSAWGNMLSRCYNKNHKDTHLYENSIVHEDWHCFQVFAEWYYNEFSNCKWNGIHCLDKDILGNGSLYSNKSCCIVPPAINTTIAHVAGGKFLLGVIQSTNGLFRVRPGYSCSDLRFNDEKSAHMAFVEAKSEKIKSLANEYREILRPHVYETLMTKDFRYKFSPFFEKPESRTG